MVNFEEPHTLSQKREKLLLPTAIPTVPQLILSNAILAIKIELVFATELLAGERKANDLDMFVACTDDAKKDLVREVEDAQSVGSPR